MKNTRFYIPFRAPESIDSSRLVTTLRRPSLDDLRSYNTSPSPSTMGVYVRSRATSPCNDSEEAINMIFHPEDNYTEFVIARAAKSGPQPVTSFAAVAADMHKAETVGSSSATSATILLSPSSPQVTWGYEETRGPPPGYAFELDDEEIVYMKEERLERARLRADLRLQPHRDSNDSVCVVQTLDAEDDEPSLSTEYIRPTSVVTFAATHSIRRMRATEDLAGLNYIKTPLDESPTHDHINPASSSLNHDEVLEKVAPKKKKTSHFSVIKQIKKRFTGNHRKVNSVDTASIKSAAVASTPTEEVKSSSASMFNIRPATTTRAPSVQSLRPSISSKRNVLLKNRKANFGKQTGTPETALLTSSTRAIENKPMRRRSASFSGYTNVVRPMWELPEDLDSDLVNEAMAVVARQSADEWVYKPQGGANSKTLEMRYVVGRNEMS